MNNNKNFWNVVGLILIIFLAIIFLNKFTGTIEKSDVLNFYSNLLVVVITVALGLITYEQTKHIQEESSKENENLKKLNQEANETNKKLVNIIERNTELEEQKNMPCVSINQEKDYISGNENEIEIEFKNIGTTIIKCIDINEIPEEVVKQSISEIIGTGLGNLSEMIVKAFNCLFTQNIKKTDFLEFFNHDIDMIEVDQTFNIKAKPRKIESDDENLYIVALSMNIETIYGKKYNEDIVILLKKENLENIDIYIIKGKYIDISIEH